MKRLKANGSWLIFAVAGYRTAAATAIADVCESVMVFHKVLPHFQICGDLDKLGDRQRILCAAVLLHATDCIPSANSSNSWQFPALFVYRDD